LNSPPSQAQYFLYSTISQARVMTCAKWPLLGSGHVKCVTKPKIKRTLYPCHYYTALAVRCVLFIAFYCVSHLARRCNRLHTATSARNYGIRPSV